LFSGGSLRSTEIVEERKGSLEKVTARPSYSRFVDRTREPGLASVREALAGARAAWDDVEAHLAEEYGLRGSFHFMYGERYGWALRFERSGRLVLAMYPNDGHLTVQIILGRTQLAEAAAMTLPLRIVKVIEAAKDYPEGKWLFVPVRPVKHAKDLRSLIALKISRSRYGRKLAASPRSKTAKRTSS
jgi:hypothetical protein